MDLKNCSTPTSEERRENLVFMASERSRSKTPKAAYQLQLWAGDVYCSKLSILFVVPGEVSLLTGVSMPRRRSIFVVTCR